MPDFRKATKRSKGQLVGFGAVVFLLCLVALRGGPETSKSSRQGFLSSDAVRVAFPTEELENAALEELRLDLLKIAGTAKSEVDIITSIVDERLSRGIEVEVFDDGLSEEEHMSVITKLARIAVEKEEQRKKERREQLLKRAKQQGIELTEMLDLDPQNQLYQDMLSMQCSRVADCTNGCEQACMKKTERGSCKRDCKTSCSASCKGKMSCERPCEKKCRKECEKKQGRGTAENCQAESKKMCSVKCSGIPKAAACVESCLEEKKKLCAFLSEEEFQSKEGCKQKCGRHLCVHNKCACPIYYTGDPLCMTPTAVKDMLPPRYAHCATPYSDGRFSKRNKRNVTILSDRSRALDYIRKYHSEFTSSMGLKMKPDPDVKDLIDFSTCAVVGSANTLLKSDLGAEIDSHSAIIRFNDAKTSGYEKDVGSRTSLRIQNVMYCGFHEHQNELCVHYTGWPGNLCPRSNTIKYKGIVLTMSWRLLEYVQNFWPKKIFHGARDTSAGFLGILMALHHCGEVNIYGFNQKSGHYYPKRTKSKTPFANKHSWILERECTQILTTLPGVTFHN